MPRALWGHSSRPLYSIPLLALYSMPTRQVKAPDQPHARSSSGRSEPKARLHGGIHDRSEAFPSSLEH